MPKAIDGYILTCDSKGRLSSLYNKEEKETVTFEYKTNVLGSTDEPNVVMTMREENEKTVYNLFLNKDGFVKYCDEIEYEKNKTYKKATWNFEYNSDGQLAKAIQSKDGFKTLYTIIYKDGDAVESITRSEKEGKEKDHYKIYYTSNKVTSPIANKGCIMAFDGGLGVDLEDFQNVYFAGMLGKATKHLPIYNINKDNDMTSFEWYFDANGFPIKVVVKDDDDREDSNIVW
jgi:putative lipoprotein